MSSDALTTNTTRRNSPVLILMLLTSISFLFLLADLIERVRYNIPYLKSLFYLIAFRRNLSPVFSFLNFFLQSRVVRTLCVVRWLRLLSLILDWELLGTSRMELDTSEYCASFFFFFCLWGEAGWQNREPGHEFTHTHSWVFFLLQFMYSMGLDHDDDSADSADGADCPNYKYIMSSEKNTAPTSYMWSPCSRTRIQTFLNSG